jgi:hypothetical protein
MSVEIALLPAVALFLSSHDSTVSKGEIARALADWQAAHDRQLERRTEAAGALIKLLQILAARPGGVRVVVHFYSGSFESDAIPLGGATSLPVERLELERSAKTR